MSLHIKRAYESHAAEDGFRILIDRLWPRGVSKDAAHIDLWLKDLAPSTELRKWFGHDPERWAEFKKRYHHELGGAEQKEALAELRQHMHQGKVTLVYGAKDEEHNDAVALQGFLQSA